VTAYPVAGDAINSCSPFFDGEDAIVEGAVPAEPGSRPWTDDNDLTTDGRRNPIGAQDGVALIPEANVLSAGETSTGKAGRGPLDTSASGRPLPKGARHRNHRPETVPLSRVQKDLVEGDQSPIAHLVDDR